MTDAVGRSAKELPHRTLVTLGVVVLAVVLAVTAYSGPAARWIVALAILLAEGVLAWGWTRLVGLPSRRGTTIVVATSAVLLTGSVVLPADGYAMRWTPAALAFCVTCAFVHQLLRQDGRPRVVASLSGSMLALAILCSGVAWIALPGLRLGPPVMASVALGLAASAGAEWTCLRTRHGRWAMPVTVLVGGLVCLAVGLLLGLGWAGALLAGVVATLVGACVRAILAPLPQLADQRVQLVSAAASLLAPGVPVYLIADLLVTGAR